MADVNEFQGIYNRLSAVDLRFHRVGLSAERRRALWARLDDDPSMKDILDGDEMPSAARDKLRADLRVCREARERAFADPDNYRAFCVYEALLAFFYLTVEGRDFVYRGHLDAGWRLVPSFFRLQPRVSLQLLPQLIYSAYRTVEKRLGQPLGLTPFGAEAAAQHYGAGTTLLDVTESLRVAAYFATTPLRPGDRQGEFGALYVLSAADLARAGRAILRAESLPPALTRIHRTRGAFVSGTGYTGMGDTKSVEDVRDIVDWLNAFMSNMNLADEMGFGIESALRDHRLEESAVIQFRQTGNQFSDPAWGVARGQF
jgi:hypothetical protein